MKKQKVMSQMKGQDKSPGGVGGWEWSGDSEPSLNEFRIMIVKMIQDLRKTMEQIQEMFTKT